MAYYTNPTYAAPFNANHSSQFTLSQNGNLNRDSMLARVVKINENTMNKAHPLSLHRTLCANPGYALLLPNSDGTFNANATVGEGKVATLLMPWLKFKRAVAIEVFSAEFMLSIPVRVNYGFNYLLDNQDIVSYQAKFTLSIHNYATFLSRFGLSDANNVIHVSTVQKALQEGLQMLSSECVTHTGHIDQRAVRSLFNQHGLFVHGNPVICEYESAQAKHLARLRKSYEDKLSAAERASAAERCSIREKAMEHIPDIIQSLVAVDASNEKIDQVLSLYLGQVENTSDSIHQIHIDSCRTDYDRLQAVEEDYQAIALPQGGQGQRYIGASRHQQLLNSGHLTCGYSNHRNYSNPPSSNNTNVPHRHFDTPNHSYHPSNNRSNAHCQPGNNRG